MLKVGSLVFIKESRKKRPHICISKFTNNAQIAYDWLLLPITSNKTVGDKNLVEVTHKKLKVPSYAKINNMKTVNLKDEMEIHTDLFSEDCIDKIKKRLEEVFKVKTFKKD